MSIFILTSTSSITIANQKNLPVIKATASSIYHNYDYLAPDRTIDGNDATYWVADSTESSWWITFDLGALNHIGNINIKWYASYLIPLDYDIQISSDGYNWEDVFTDIQGVYDPQGEVRTINRKTRYIRLHIDEVTYFAPILREFSVYKITVPHAFTFQASLQDRDGMPLNGTYTLTFKLYDTETGGTPLWQEVHQEIDIQDGLLQAELGSITPFDYLSFDRQYWLGIEVASDNEMTPRFKLTSTPYAFISEE